MKTVHNCCRLREDLGCPPCLLSDDMDDFEQYRTCINCVFHHPINTPGLDHETNLRIKLESLKTLFALGERVDRGIFCPNEKRDASGWRELASV